MQYWKYIACAGIGLMLAGCTSSGGGASYEARDTTPPSVANFAITPPDGSWRGGTCQVAVTATDNDQVAQVVAGISGPGLNTQVPLTKATSSSSSYQGGITIPANTNGDGRTNTYYVTAWAIDATGNSSTVTQSLSFTVTSPDGPPVGPPGW